MRAESLRKAMVALSVSILALITIYYSLKLPSFGEIMPLADYYLSNAWKETGAMNAVSALVWDYRGYDTLGETTVLFTAIIGALVILRRSTRKIRRVRIREHYSLIVRTSSRLVIPILSTIGIAVTFAGDVISGGGFQGGAILACAFIFYMVALGLTERRALIDLARLKRLQAIGLCLIWFTALAGISIGWFMENVNHAIHIPIFHAGSISLFGIGEAINVFCAFSLASIALVMLRGE